ncbi:MAG TPA: hypothetical protein VLM37_05695 [Fibrobacteraceae bacterium]|nr:hypothetical protein [Fibrobacteraceae bacterium]
MNHRLMLLGDSFGGDSPSAGDLLADMLLVEHPEMPLAFTIQFSNRNTLDFLFDNCARDVIGKQAGLTLFLLGWEEILSSLSGEEVLARYSKLAHEILENSSTQLLACTLPLESDNMESLRQMRMEQLNMALRSWKFGPRWHLVDLAEEFQQYQIQQRVRAELARNLFVEQGVLGPLGGMLFAKVLSRKIAAFMP